MASDKRTSETGRWASEGGADPHGPATHVPAVEKRRVTPQLEPPTTPNPRGQRRTGHVTQASDAPEPGPPPGQQEQPEEGVEPPAGEAQPNETGESG
jgi:hypothetical protein